MDSKTRLAIEKETALVLKRAGITGPPVNIEQLLYHLKLHRDFYSLEDPGFVQRVMFEMQTRMENLYHVVRKSKLVAAWFPENSKIVVDRTLHPHKINWASFHEVTHSVLPWHRPFYLGDTAQTLDPAFQQDLESEANLGASCLIYCGDVFTKDALQAPVSWNSVTALSKRYGASLTATSRRLVLYGHDLPMCVLVIRPWWLLQGFVEDQEDDCRHFVRSPRFESEFGSISSNDLLLEVKRNVWPRKGGPLGDFSLCLENNNGVPFEFFAESFFNTHDVVVLFVQRRRMSKTISFDEIGFG